MSNTIQFKRQSDVGKRPTITEFGEPAVASNGALFVGARGGITTLCQNIVHNVSIPTSSWVQNSDGTFQYTATITGVSATSIIQPSIGNKYTTTPTLAQKKEIARNMGYINEIKTDTNSVTLICYDTKPTINLDLILTEIFWNYG